ncbi:MAG: hypothetical protein QXX36_02830 [Candidatus Rehaiarchaeum fermentans]|nr:hypothetical protein [Candidatus Rehaiarchaeum fermentans]MCW1297128.1 hypothetical protein [Candidatus Rehaiarchaeum fermentans]MCW1302534.1 hypothetical protein [Candidatus Rehaiarchaeum fermentans]
MKIKVKLELPEEVVGLIDEEKSNRFSIIKQNNEIIIDAKDLNIFKSLINRIIKLLITIEKIDIIYGK